MLQEIYKYYIQGALYLPIKSYFCFSTQSNDGKEYIGGGCCVVGDGGRWVDGCWVVSCVSWMECGGHCCCPYFIVGVDVTCARHKVSVFFI